MNTSSDASGGEKNGTLKVNAVLFGAFVGLFISQVYTTVMFFHFRNRIDRADQVVEQTQKVMSEGIAKVNQNSSSLGVTSRRKLKTIQEELEELKHQTSATVTPAEIAALSNVQKLVEKLGFEREAQQEQHDHLASQVSELAQVTGTANVRLMRFNDDLQSVRADVASTKTDLNRTASDLKRVRDDMGVMSGLIATNVGELKVLRAIGDRSYFELRLTKSREPKKVGDISVLLKKADPAKERYTLEVYFDHQRIQKKDRTTNEPVQFYATGSRQPYEIVVNTITKDQVVVYLAAPATPGYAHQEQNRAAIE